MGQGNLRGRAAHIHSHGTELMPGIAALDRLRGGAISMRKELEQMGKKKTGVGSWVCGDDEVPVPPPLPPLLPAAYCLGSAGVCMSWKVDF